MEKNTINLVKIIKVSIYSSNLKKNYHYSLHDTNRKFYLFLGSKYTTMAAYLKSPYGGFRGGKYGGNISICIRPIMEYIKMFYPNNFIQDCNRGPDKVLYVRVCGCGGRGVVH